MRERTAKAAGFLVVTVILLCAAVITSAACTRVGAICKDGTFSEATGSGACSWHRGVDRWRVQPEVTVRARSGTVLTCRVQSIYLDATVSCGERPYSYFWSPGGETTEDITVTTPGTYILTVREDTGVSTSYSVDVTESKTPPTLDTGQDVSVSCGEPVVLNAIISGGVSPYTYSWSPGGEKTREITVITPGIYTLTVTGANGCSATDQVVVIEDPSPPSVDAGLDRDLTCNSPSTLLDATVTGGEEPYTFRWTPGGEDTEDITVSSPGTYELTVTGANGCSKSDTVTVIRNTSAPVVEVEPERRIFLIPVKITPRVSGGSPPYTYVWSPSGGNTASVVLTSPGVYTLTVVGSNGCSATYSIEITRNWRLILAFTLSGIFIVLVVIVIWRLRLRNKGKSD